MASTTEDKVATKKRKQNFSVAEISVLTENVEQNIDVLSSKLTTSVTNKRKAEIWTKVTAAVNALGVESRTVQEVKDKWKNLHSAAKKEFSTFKIEPKKTGGGLPPKKPNASTQKIIDIFKDTPSFVGIDGFETGMYNNKYSQFSYLFPLSTFRHYLTM